MPSTRKPEWQAQAFVDEARTGLNTQVGVRDPDLQG